MLVIYTIVDPRSDDAPPIMGPRTEAQEALVSAAYAEMMATGRSRRIILDNRDGG